MAGGWQGSDRLQRLPPDWKQRRARVFRRDGHRCTALDPQSGQRCPEAATDCDHIRPGDDHSDGNLRSLCAWHHQRKSSTEGGTARAAQWRRNDKKFRRTEQHPGLL